MSSQLDVYVGVASIPSRVSTLQRVVERLLPQASRVGVYLNGYDRVPKFLRRERIDVARSQDHGDLRDNGKFFFLSHAETQYYASVDDDILYPDDYLDRLIGTLDKAEQPAAVGVHGAMYPFPVIDLFDSRYLLHFKDPSPHVMPVHLLGTGTTLIDQSEWGLELAEFGAGGMADIWFAAAAARRNARLFVVRRGRDWLTPLETGKGRIPGGNLFYEGLLDDSAQVSMLRQAAISASGFRGMVLSLVANDAFGEELSLHQAIALDRIRAQLGYPALSTEDARDLSKVLESGPNGSSEGWPVAPEYRGLAIDVLADRSSADSVLPIMALLDQWTGLSESDPDLWKTLPHAVRYDSRGDRVEQLKKLLVEKGAQRSADDARRLWSLTGNQPYASLSFALKAERSSIRTGFQSLADLESLATESPTAAATRLYEYFEANDWSVGPDLDALRQAFGSDFESLDLQMVLCMAAARSGDRQLATRILGWLTDHHPADVDVQLMSASLVTTEVSSPIDAMRPVLEVLDETLEKDGVTPYGGFIRANEKPEHWIDQLSSSNSSTSADPDSAATVSVLMTTHNDARTIRSAMRSILASTGVKLQLVVVDDASTDDTLRLAMEVADPRVTIVQNEVNCGPYLSRNRGLEHTTGDYVAIADADDWSHPQRLWFQSSIMEATSTVYAHKVAHVRIRPDGRIDLENHLRFVGDGPMSLMFRRWLIEHIGGFDHVRTRGDIEFLRRLTARFGPDALVSHGTPMVLATSSPTSNSKRFRDDSLNLYRSAARKWHQRRLRSDSLYVPLSGTRAPFMAPHDLIAHYPTGPESPGAAPDPLPAG